MPSALFNITEQIYNQSDFSALDHLLSQTGRKLSFDPGVTLQPREGEILVMIEGSLTVSDGTENSLVIGYAYPYMPVGIVERYYHLPLYYRAESRVAMVQLTEEEADIVFLSTPERAALFSRIMAYMSATLVHIYYERNNSSGYATIRDMLWRYLSNVEKAPSNNEGIAMFILKRTRLSRSYVFQVLAMLKTGGYITMQRGKLISINRDVPKRY